MKDVEPARCEAPEVYLLRMSRELDRFVVALMRVEHSTVQLLDCAGKDAPRAALASLQSIDYLRQCSSAMSELLTHISHNGADGLAQRLEATRPTDLASRLRNENIDDIDNQAAQTQSF